MSTPRDMTQHLSERLQSVVCSVRGHKWAGARQHAAQADGLLLCVRCGFEETGRAAPALPALAQL